MKFIGLNARYKMNKEKLRVAISVGVILLTCAFSVLAVSTIIDTQSKAHKAARDAEIARQLQEASELASLETTTTSSQEEDAIAPSVLITDALQDMTSATTGSELAQDTSISETAETMDTTLQTTEETTATTTAATTTATTTTAPAFEEEELYTVVYAMTTLNVRSGPGTEYSLVKTIEAGSAIDVIGVTSNGWYHTYNDNYVLCSLTQNTPIATATPVPTPTSAPASSGDNGGGNGGGNGGSGDTGSTGGSAPEGMTFYGSCTITFYGPQPLGDGSYSVTTATGTTCTQGRTCAADWSVFPAGTTIYVENDPLGGDGYYTVEDRGGAVIGSHIDIYADDPYAIGTTSRNVYVVN